MFRVRLASGEEAVYRGVEELALGIQSGVITASAEIFHGKSDKWLPITSHPEYSAAVERAATLVATEEEPAMVEPIRGGVPQVYQMFSRSAKELAERRRPRRWQARLVGSVAGLVLVAATALTLIQTPEGSDEAVLPPGVLRSQSAHTGTPPSELSQQARGVLLAPYNLANRFARAKEAAATALSDSAAKLQLAGALRIPRLTHSDSLRRTLAGLTVLAPLIREYRAELRRLQVAYRDTAAGLMRGGNWTRSDAQEWRARIFVPEQSTGALRADTLLATLTRIYAFLLAEPNRTSASGKFVAGSDSAGATYDRLRNELARLRAITDEQQIRAGAPLRIVLAVMGSDTLPARSGS